MVTTAGRGTNRGTRSQTRLRGGVPSCVLLRPSSGKCGGEEGKTGTVAHIDLRVSVGRACEGWGGADWRDGGVGRYCAVVFWATEPESDARLHAPCTPCYIVLYTRRGQHPADRRAM